MANIQMSEFQIQMAFHQWCLKQPFITLSWHVPNGVLSTAEHIRKMKLIGLTRGVPDYWIILNNNKILAIEFKTNSKSSKLSEDQRRVRDVLINNPFIHYAECRSSYEATQFVKGLL